MPDSNQAAQTQEDVQGDQLTGDELTGEGASASGAPGRTYEPSRVEATRERQQGLGVGAKDIDYQRDATQADSTEHYGARPDGNAQEALGGDSGAAEGTGQAGPPGKPDKAYDDRDADEVSTDWPAG